ncbi:ABC transporter permease [Azospirillum sp. RWY-5-1]|uniref:ABC transporter permease n=1 Tax=Azospirillum oleiclasticum TaxID=2735135 RepID=A0ABX2TJG8_9PROT|nr:ABC transporter permease [Azospirillum oleiclasticum]NYZ14424.1 ABC transporter permease [Azospirillum oleiclasticum]NYZ23224.1 ABC transporter permease [Azospirillum oleiclasticum]
MRNPLTALDKPALFAAGSILLILAVGSLYTLSTGGGLTMLSPAYLSQQLQIAAFLGLIAGGLMMVILLGHIDLSIPWTLTAAAMMATSVGGPAAVPVALAVGLAVGVVNGLGVAWLRVPSMIFTLGVNTVLQGLMVLHTGGHAPQSRSTGLMEFLATGHVLGLPMAALVWAAVSGLLVVLLTRTAMGRAVYAIGNRESAAYLSGIPTNRVIVGCFAICGACAALAGCLLAGYSTKAYQGMGNAYLLPGIAAVVIGGTHVLGGRGTYTGTVLGTILIVVLQSVLSVMQMPDAGRQIIYGLVIIAMLFAYGRDTGRAG